VRRTIGQMQVQSIGSLADEQSFARQTDAGRGWITQIGEEHAFPESPARHGLDVLHVKDSLREALVKHAGLYFERDLRRLEAILELSQGGERSGRKIDTVAKSEQPCSHHEDRDHTQKGPYADAAGAHGGDFAVGGEAAESDEDADKYAHRNGVSKCDGDGKEKYFCNTRQWRTIADYQFEDVAEVAGKKNECENRRADQGVGDDFAQNVAGEDAHPQGWWLFASLA